MIHDKDYIIRIVKQFSEFLGKMIMGGKNDGDSTELQRIFDTNMNDTFKMTFEKLAEKDMAEIIELIEAKEPAHQIAFYELLGHLFYFKFKEEERPAFAEKSIVFYELFVQKSGIFSMPIVSRISELKANV